MQVYEFTYDRTKITTFSIKIIKYAFLQNWLKNVRLFKFLEIYFRNCIGSR